MTAAAGRKMPTRFANLVGTPVLPVGEILRSRLLRLVLAEEARDGSTERHRSGNDHHSDHNVERSLHRMKDARSSGAAPRRWRFPVRFAAAAEHPAVGAATASTDSPQRTLRQPSVSLSGFLRLEYHWANHIDPAMGIPSGSPSTQRPCTIAGMTISPPTIAIQNQPATS